MTSKKSVEGQRQIEKNIWETTEIFSLHKISIPIIYNWDNILERISNVPIENQIT